MAVPYRFLDCNPNDFHKFYEAFTREKSFF